MVRGIIVENKHNSDIEAKSIKFDTDVRFDKKKYQEKILTYEKNYLLTIITCLKLGKDFKIK